MKTRSVLVAGLVGLSFLANAQKDENDDMYFNRKDRAKLNAGKSFLVRETAAASVNTDLASNAGNPTDTYSGRSVNPEYAGPSTATAKQQTYFPSGFNYNPTGVNSNLYNNYNSSYNSSYGCNCYGSNYGMGYNPYMMNGFGYGYSPYSSMYSSMYYSPYSMFSPYSMMGSGWSLGYGYGSYYGYGSPYMSGYYGYGWPYSYYSYYPYSYGGYGSGSGDHGNPRVIGHRPSRSDMHSMAGTRTGNYYTSSYSNGGTGRTVTGGRNAASNNNSYYDRSWRQNPNVNPAANHNGNGSRVSSYSNGNYSGGWNGSSSRSGWSGGRSSSWGGNSNFGNGGFGGGGRSSSFGGGGGFSGGGGGGHSGGGGGHGRGR